METLTIELHPALAARLREAAAANHYASPAKLVEGLIEDWEMTSDPEHLAWLRARVAEADANAGPDLSLDEAYAHVTRTIERVERERA